MQKPKRSPRWRTIHPATEFLENILVGANAEIIARCSGSHDAPAQTLYVEPNGQDPWQFIIYETSRILRFTVTPEYRGLFTLLTQGIFRPLEPRFIAKVEWRAQQVTA